MKRTGIKVEFTVEGVARQGIIPAVIDKSYQEDWGMDPKKEVLIWFEDESGKEWRTFRPKDEVKVLGYIN